MKFIYKPFGHRRRPAGRHPQQEGLREGLGASSRTRIRADPDDRDATWTEVLASAAVSGVIFEAVQALRPSRRRQGLRARHGLLARRRTRDGLSDRPDRASRPSVQRRPAPSCPTALRLLVGR